jgi:hypothetical protein
MDDPADRKFLNRRQLEVVAMLEFAAAIKAGEMFVNTSLSYDRFWDRLPREAADPAAIATYAASKGWGEGADGLIRSVACTAGPNDPGNVNGANIDSLMASVVASSTQDQFAVVTD